MLPTLRTCASLSWSGLFTPMHSVVKVAQNFATFGTLLIVFMDNLVMFYMALFTFEFYVASAIFFDFLHPSLHLKSLTDFCVALHMGGKLPFICEDGTTMLTCPGIANTMDLFHVLIHSGLWIAFSTILTWDLL